MHNMYIYNIYIYIYIFASFVVRHQYTGSVPQLCYRMQNAPMRLPTVRFMVTPFASGSDLSTKHVAQNKSATAQDVLGDSNPMQETASGAASLDDFMFILYGPGNQGTSPSCDLAFVSKRV